MALLRGGGPAFYAGTPFFYANLPAPPRGFTAWRRDGPGRVVLRTAG